MLVPGELRRTRRLHAARMAREGQHRGGPQCDLRQCRGDAGQQFRVGRRVRLLGDPQQRLCGDPGDKRLNAHMGHLPEMRKEIKELKKQLEELKGSKSE